MKALDEFNESVSSLQKEVGNLQAIRQAYQQLATLADDYEKVISNLSVATKDMATAKVAMEKQTTEVKEKLAEQKKLLETELSSIQEKLAQNLVDLQKLIESKADDISEANKKFYNDFSNTVQTRLDNNKMESKQLIDQDSQSTRLQINELKQELKTQTANLTKQLADTQTALSQQLLLQKKISLAFGIVVVIFCVILIIFRFV